MHLRRISKEVGLVESITLVVDIDKLSIEFATRSTLGKAHIVLHSFEVSRF